MTDLNVENVSQVGGGLNANQAASPTPGASPSAVDVKALVEALTPVLEQMVERKTQSVKDKRIAKLQSAQDELLARYDELIKEPGMTPAKARRELLLDQLLETQVGGSAPAAPQPQPGKVVLEADAEAKVLETLGLDANLPEVLQVRGSNLEPADRLVALINIANKHKEAAQRPANTAQVMSAGGGASVGGVSEESLAAEYRELTKNFPPGEMGAKQRFDTKLAIRKKAAQAGVKSPV